MAWCFGLRAPGHLRWRTGGREVEFWYTKRLEHIHTLPQPWELEDEFRRSEAWLSLGVDDALEVSVPWSRDGGVRWTDAIIPVGAPGGDARYPTIVREYKTPSGPLRHAVKKTGGEDEGWVIQPDGVPLFEDYNVPRAVKHAVASPADLPPLRHLLRPPAKEEREWFEARMEEMKEFACQKGLLVQAWSAFGMDGAVWLAGGEGAVLMALDFPEAFEELLEIIFEVDSARTELAAANAGVDLICMRGWYSSTDFWSPQLFDRFVTPRLTELVELTHRHGKKFAYVMTTGAKTLGPKIRDAGVDLLFFVDPVQDGISPEEARVLLGGQMALAGGTNALSLASGDPARIRQEVRRALEVLGPTGRFILQPVDALFPDTPWQGVEAMIEAWKEFR